MRGEGGWNRQIFEKLLNKNAIKPKIGGPPGNFSWKPWPPLGFWQKLQVAPPLDFQPVCIYAFSLIKTAKINFSLSFSCESAIKSAINVWSFQLIFLFGELDCCWKSHLFLFLLRSMLHRNGHLCTVHDLTYRPTLHILIIIEFLRWTKIVKLLFIGSLWDNDWVFFF